MGLDMYLNGRTWPKEEDHEDREWEEIAYWRKHPNLHGFIVKTFAGGVDECQEIPLEVADLEKIVSAVKADGLPPTSGFFFGRSDCANQDETLEKLEKAIDWARGDGLRRVIYRASW